MYLVWPCIFFTLSLSHFPQKLKQFLIRLGWDSIFRTKILCYHTILIVYEEKVFFLVRLYPLLTISITHCVTYDLMMIGRKEKKYLLGSIKVAKARLCKLQKEWWTWNRTGRIPIGAIHNKRLAIFSHFSWGQLFFTTRIPISFFSCDSKIFHTSKQSSCKKELMNCSAYG